MKTVYVEGYEPKDKHLCPCKVVTHHFLKGDCGISVENKFKYCFDCLKYNQYRRN